MNDNEMSKKRKVVQLTAVNGELILLCDDGTVWEEKCDSDGERTWKRVNTNLITEILT